ncbi:MAG: aminotransferase class V-fold PLP-dependent enzyme [Bacteroidota bacterium]
MSARRSFLKQSTLGLGALFTPPFLQTASGERLLTAITKYADQDMTTNEDFWYLIQQAYTVSANILNLNNGGVSPQPRVVQEAVERYNQLSNETPSYYMWRILDQGREVVREKLADIAGCNKEELAINRNATEALETVIFGLLLEKGDEVIGTLYDYPNMINAWKQRARRDGIRYQQLDLPFSRSDDEIVELFTDAFTDKTKVVHLTHMINWTGRILPVRRIADAARERGIEVIVDAAHTFAHIDYRIEDLGADYWGTSLHKWLCAPFGSGMLYVKKEKIPSIYPLFGAPEGQDDNIRKFEHLGTRSFAIEQAIGQATDFHAMIGSKRKEKRLRYLKNYWLERISDLPMYHVHTSDIPEQSCAIALLGTKDRPAKELGSYLFRDHKIHTTTITWADVDGVRITPNVYTTTRDLNRLVKALRIYSKT